MVLSLSLPQKRLTGYTPGSEYVWFIRGRSTEKSPTDLHETFDFVSGNVVKGRVRKPTDSWNWFGFFSTGIKEEKYFPYFAERIIERELISFFSRKYAFSISTLTK